MLWPIRRLGSHSPRGGPLGAGATDCTGALSVLKVVGEPSESFPVAPLLDDTAHEHFQGTNVVGRDGALLTSGEAVTSQMPLQHILRDSGRDINLVAQNDEGHLGEVVLLKQTIKLGLGLRETGRVGCVDQEHNRVNLGEVILPQPSGFNVTTKVKSAELDVTHIQLLHIGVDSRPVKSKLILLQHVKQSRLPSIVKTQEQDLTTLAG